MFILFEIVKSDPMSTGTENENSSKENDVEGPSLRLPSNAALEKIILGIMDKTGEVRSLKLMTGLVNKELDDAGYEKHTTAPRVKRIILERKLANIKVNMRRWDGQGLASKCPVCDHGLKNEKNVTIYGWMITLKQVCPKCGYWTDRKKTSVSRYTFSPITNE